MKMEYVFKTDDAEAARTLMKAQDMSVANYNIYYHWRNLAKHGDSETYTAQQVFDVLLGFWTEADIDPVED